MSNQNQDRFFTVKRFLDPESNPPTYKDEELPTQTVKFQGHSRKVRERAPHGTTLGSVRLTGSYYETALGTYSLRVTRVSVFSGSRNNAWHIRHSRQGTVDVIDFPSPGQHVNLGGPYEPVYSFGPGTVTWGFIGDSGAGIGSAYNMSQAMEGHLGYGAE
jgi:hypothetical protein